MIAFTESLLQTKTKLGIVTMSYVTVDINGLKTLTFAEAYEDFIDALYNEHKAVVFNGKAICLHKKVAYVAKLESTLPPVTLYNSWTKIENLKHEFKMFIGIDLEK